MNVKRVQREAKISQPINTSIFLRSGMIEMHMSVQLQKVLNATHQGGWFATNFNLP